MQLSSFVAFLCFASTSATAQSLLPEGIGLVQWRYRGYSPQDQEYGAAGQRQPIGDRFQQDFTGESLATGRGGGDLQRLVQELNQFEGSSDGLGDDLELGSLRGDVSAHVNAQVLAIGYGAKDRWTLFAGVPFVKAEVDAEMRLVGENNAAELRDRLGNLAFRELSDGLTRASQLSVNDIQASFVDHGYQSVGSWSHEGVGDLEVGSMKLWRSRLARGVRGSSLWTMTATVPTGYVEDPDILTDVSTGQGHYSLRNRLEPRLKFRHGLWVGTGAAYQWNLPSKRTVRIPEGGETLIDRDRTRKVDWEPGDEVTLSSAMGWQRRWAGLSLRVSESSKWSDRYDGSLEGNYDRLAMASDQRRRWVEAQVHLNSARAFLHRRFPVPVKVDLTYQQTLSGKNVVDHRYWELAVASFFGSRR